MWTLITGYESDENDPGANRWRSGLIDRFLLALLVTQIIEMLTREGIGRMRVKLASLSQSQSNNRSNGRVDQNH